MKNYPRIKFCGMTRKEDILKAITLKTDFIGYIFYPPSPRYIAPAEAAELGEVIDFKTTRKVGVFVDTPSSEIISTTARVGLDVIQLHGDDDINKIKEIEEETKAMIWKTVRMKDHESLNLIRHSPLEYFLIDTFSPISYGGTGERINLKLVKKSCQLQKGDTKHAQGRKVIVAGGLDPMNVTSILPYSPWGIDINSGAETAPGIKDHQKMESVIQAVSIFG